VNVRPVSDSYHISPDTGEAGAVSEISRLRPRRTEPYNFQYVPFHTQVLPPEVKESSTDGDDGKSIAITPSSVRTIITHYYQVTVPVPAVNSNKVSSPITVSV
jgi:hypothetical protein